MNKIFVFFILSVCLIAGCKKGKIKKQGCSDGPVHTTFDGGYLAMPNIFTPNDDGINDDLQVYGSGISSFKLTILDGKKSIYETNDYHAYWGGAIDGERNDGVFNYEIEVTTEKGQSLSFEGNVLSLVEAGEDYCINNSGKCVFGDQYLVLEGFTFPTQDPVASNISCE
ncbi:MAG: gliding motility-associated C-terminal domain-containing protein [Bacteroidia bacterium]